MKPAPSDTPDDALVALCLQGDDGAWESLVNRYRSLVMSVAVRRGLDHADAAEVFQATWVQVWEALPRLRHVDRLAGWIASVARSRCGRLHRGTKAARRSEEAAREKSLFAAGGEDDGPSPERLQEVREALDALGARCRDLLRLLYFEDAAYADITRSTGLATGSIGPTRARCLRKLKDRLRGGE